jgi:hypothetical protein
MKIRVTQIDGKLPNLALMKLSHFFKSQGHEVYFEHSVRRGIFEPDYDLVFGSAIFSTSEKKVLLFRSEFPQAKIGGTGSGEKWTVEQVIVDHLEKLIENYLMTMMEDENFPVLQKKYLDRNYPDYHEWVKLGRDECDEILIGTAIACCLDLSKHYDNLNNLLVDVKQNGYEHYDYSIYPDFRHSIGFSQRGCRLRCKFCVVPEKEGKNRSVNGIGEIWRGEGYPKNLLLLDNDFFGQHDWREKAEEIISGGFKVCFSQGINVRLFDREAAQVLGRMKYYDDAFKRKRIYTAWDNLRDADIFFRGIGYLTDAGIKPDEIMVYFLCNYWEKGLTSDVWERFERMKEIGLRPYPMVYDIQKADPEIKAFQTWVIRRAYMKIPFQEYHGSGYRKPGPIDLFSLR